MESSSNGACPEEADCGRRRVALQFRWEGWTDSVPRAAARPRKHGVAWRLIATFLGGVGCDPSPFSWPEYPEDASDGVRHQARRDSAAADSDDEEETSGISRDASASVADLDAASTASGGSGNSLTDCKPNTLRCEDEWISLCDQDGRWHALVECADDTPRCVEGVCRECDPLLDGPVCRDNTSHACAQGGRYEPVERCLGDTPVCLSQSGQCVPCPMDCSDGSPTITTFLSSEANLPGGGGETTLSWNTSGADSLRIENDEGPEVGVVSGTFQVVAVDRTTTFTLVATNAAGETRRDVTVPVSAQGELDWVVQLGTTEDDYVHSVATDETGQVLVVGSTGGALVTPLNGMRDSVIYKYTPAGDSAWGIQFGSQVTLSHSAVATDVAGNLFVSGTFRGVFEKPSVGESDAFVQRLSTDGEVLWTDQLGTESYDYGTAVATDRAGNGYLVGTTEEADLFGQGAGKGQDLFIVKYSGEGKRVWSHQRVSDDNVFVGAVAVADPGHIFVVGHVLVPGGRDGLLLKYSQDGELVWTKAIATTGDDYGLSVATTANGGVVVAGTTTGQFPGPNDAGAQSLFVLKSSPSGDIEWRAQFTSGVYDSAEGIAVDALGNVFVAGTTRAPNADDYDVLVIKLSPAGETLWKRQLGTSSYDRSFAIATDAFGNVFLTGYTTGALGLAQNVGGTDGFLARLR